jgi:uncharacterized protein
MPTFSRLITLMMIAWGLVLGACLVWAQRANVLTPAATMTLNVGIHNIRAELAQTDVQRSTGLMNRSRMGAHEGMLFVFETPGQQCFWMKNTLLPLSIAFLADDGTVVHIDDMQPQSLLSHCSPEPVRLALERPQTCHFAPGPPRGMRKLGSGPAFSHEMNQGWFAKRGVKVGMKMTGAIFKGGAAR